MLLLCEFIGLLQAGDISFEGKKIKPLNPVYKPPTKGRWQIEHLQRDRAHRVRRSGGRKRCYKELVHVAMEAKSYDVL